MTTGKAVGFPGNALPVLGEAEIKQTSSGTDVVTLTLNSSITSTAGGRALVVGRNKGNDTLDTTAELFTVQYDGVQARRHVVAISTASSNIVMAASQSGALCVIGDNTGTETVITLPTARTGLWYEFYQSGSGKASAATIQSATAGMMVCFNESSANSIDIGGSTAGAVGGSLRVIAGTLNSSAKWFVVTQPNYTSAAPNGATTVNTLYARAT